MVRWKPGRNFPQRRSSDCHYCSTIKTCTEKSVISITDAQQDRFNACSVSVNTSPFFLHLIITMLQMLYFILITRRIWSQHVQSMPQRASALCVSWRLNGHSCSHHLHKLPTSLTVILLLLLLLLSLLYYYYFYCCCCCRGN